MRKTLAIVFLLIFALSVFSLSCPRGEVNDTYPGDCSLYTDLNKDGICDLSQPLESCTTAQNVKTDSVTTVTGAGVVKDNNLIATKVVDVKPVSAFPINDYAFLPITIVLLILYLGSYGLVKMNKFLYANHIKVWNIFLLITFLVMASCGLLLVIRIAYGFSLPLPFNLLDLHVKAGIAMSIISIFHIVWHYKYFWALVQQKKKTEVKN